MREVEQMDFTYSDDDYVSVFIGQCASQNKLIEYVSKDYKLLRSGYIGSEIGIDFGINTFDEDFLIATVHDETTTEVGKILKDADPDIISMVVDEYSEHFPEAYNSCILLDGIKYEGETKEAYNPDFGVFKFIGYFPSV